MLCQMSSENYFKIETLTRDSDRSVVARDRSFTESHHFSRADSYTPHNDVEQHNNWSVEVSHRRTCWVIHQTPIPVRWGTEIHLRNRHFRNPKPKHRSHHHRLIQAACVLKLMCPSQTHDTQSHARVLYTTLQCHVFHNSDPKLQHSDRSLLLMSLMMVMYSWHWQHLAFHLSLLFSPLPMVIKGYKNFYFIFCPTTCYVRRIKIIYLDLEWTTFSNPKKKFI